MSHQRALIPVIQCATCANEFPLCMEGLLILWGGTKGMTDHWMDYLHYQDLARKYSCPDYVHDPQVPA